MALLRPIEDVSIDNDGEVALFGMGNLNAKSSLCTSVEDDDLLRIRGDGGAETESWSCSFKFKLFSMASLLIGVDAEMV